MTYLARGVALRLRVLQPDGDLAQRNVPASVGEIASSRATAQELSKPMVNSERLVSCKVLIQQQFTIFTILTIRKYET